MGQTATGSPLCCDGHALEKTKGGLLGWKSYQCEACEVSIDKSSDRFANKSDSYHLCMKCAQPPEGSVAVGVGPYIFRAFVPPGSYAGDMLNVLTPDGQTMSVRVPPKKVPGAALDV